MRRVALSIALVSAALMLSACAIADSRSPVPEFMRAKAADPPPGEPPPDVKELVRSHLESVFVASSYPQNVKVSQAHHEPRGLGWTACVKAALTSATGNPLGEEIYRITIDSGVITDRRLVEPEDTCITESYQPI